jgi:D-alanyl-lipoteichoic acid acyltransferase DltB (MBOAT superfamily)
MLFSTATDFVVGLLLERETDDRKRRRIFAVSLIVNLGILGFFKYFNFFVDSADQLFNTWGIQLDTPTLQVLLPVGISFYTFHGISYTFDVYRREIRAARDPIDFAVFVSFFPQLVAGPIGRAQLQLPQFQRSRVPPKVDQVRSALFLILLGLFKKVAIADALAGYVNETFSTASAGWVTLMLGVYAFALQIYCDFSGYTDMARGSARLLGIELPVNFAQPYLSRNITEFWRRWHISLSSWLRDYLYIPLGGSRWGTWRTYRNLMLTMLIGGLWHGAAWTFVIWGGLHGLFLALHKAWTGRRPARDPATQPRWLTLLSIVFTFNLVCGAWIFFRAGTLDIALRYCKGILTLRPGPVDGDFVLVLLLAAIAVFTIDILQRRNDRHEFVLNWPAVARGAAYAALVLPVLIFSGGTPTPFIYFQF